VGDGCPIGGEEEEDDETPAGSAPSIEREGLSAPPALEPEVQPEPGAPPRQLAPRLVTLSARPRAQWSELMHAEALRKRGKPEAPPERPQAAPFFLPTLPSLAPQPVFAVQPVGGSRVIRGGAGALHGGDAAQSSPLLAAVSAGAESGDYAAARAHVRSCGAAALDSDIRSLALSSVGGQLQEGDEAALLLLFSFLAAELEGGRDFELMHAALASALRAHGDAAAGSERLARVLRELRRASRAAWARLDAQFQEARCTLAFLAGLGQS
jgi:U3 small nucleolar RNA-associated protein 21